MKKWDQFIELNIKKLYFVFVIVVFVFGGLYFFQHYAKEETSKVVEMVWSEVELLETGEFGAISGHPAFEISSGQRIMFYLHHLDAEVYINDRFVYSDTKEEIGWGSFLSEGLTSNDKIVFVLKKESLDVPDRVFQMLLDSVCVGNKYDLMTRELHANTLRNLVCFLLFVVGIGVLMASLGIIAIGIKPVSGGISCGLLIVVGAVTTSIDYAYVTLLIPKFDLIFMIDKVSQGLICVLLMIYLKSYISAKEHYVFVNWFILLGILCSTVFMGMQLCGYSNYRLFESTVVPVFMIWIMIEFAMVVVDGLENNSKSTRLIMFSTMFLAVATLAELMHYYLTNYFWINLFLLGLVVFSFTQVYVIMMKFKDVVHELERAGQLESELVRQHVTMMLSQIQPHFLFNAMTSIRALCDENPQSAKAAMGDLAVYLRGNMDSLSSSVPIPFTKEMGHLESYLALERIRFEDRLNVDYKIEADDFCVPALTIQPLVENAIKHGIAKKENGGTVTIHTYRTDEGVVIEVSDDGVGVEFTSIEALSEKNDGRSHIGLKNVKSRVSDMCKGTFEFESVKGQGTIVTILIPNDDGDDLT